MSLFGVRTPRRGASGLTVVDDRLTIRGDIDSDGTVRVDGRVEGTAHRVGKLIVGSHGSVVGNVAAVDVIVAGSIEGNVHAAGRVEIEPGASVRGDVRADALVMHEGAAVHGHMSVEAPQAQTVERQEEHLEFAPTPAARSIAA